MGTIKNIKTEKYKIKVVMPEDDKMAYISESDAEMDARANKAIEVALEKAKFCKKPIAKYDLDTKQAYVEYPNGDRDYVN